MRRLALLAALVLSLDLPAWAQPAAAPVAPPAATAATATIGPATATSADLIEDAKAWDGKTVVFAGEAIGDPMRRGTHAWINVLDSNAAMGIWMTVEEARGVRHFGSYRMTGDSLRITGSFHRACPEHGGDMDIHATKVELVSEGSARSHPVDRLDLLLALPLAAVAGFLLAAWRRREALVGRKPG